MRGIDDVQEEVGLRRLRERRAKRRDEIVREVADESDGVRQHDRFGAGHVEPAQRRVERREQLVGSVGARAGETIEKRRLAGVCIADERDGAHRGAAPRAALGGALPGDLREASVQHLDARAEEAAIGFELFFAGAAKADAALLALEVAPAADEPRQLVIHLRELDLQLAFGAARAKREDVEDEGGAINDSAIERFLEIALLRPGQRVPENHDVGTGLDAPRGDLLDLALAREERGVGPLPPARPTTPATAAPADSASAVSSATRSSRVARSEIEHDEQRAITALRAFEHGWRLALRPNGPARRAVARLEPAPRGGGDAGLSSDRSADSRRQIEAGWPRYPSRVRVGGRRVVRHGDRARGHHRRNGVLVHHLRDRVLEQDDVLVERFDLALKLDAVDEIDRDLDVLLAQRVQEGVLQHLPFVAHRVAPLLLLAMAGPGPGLASVSQVGTPGAIVNGPCGGRVCPRTGWRQS